MLFRSIPGTPAVAQTIQVMDSTGPQVTRLEVGPDRKYKDLPQSVELAIQFSDYISNLSGPLRPELNHNSLYSSSVPIPGN